MASLNRCTFMGNLTRDPELKYTPKGTAVCNFGLAINEKWTDDAGQKKESTVFLDFVAFGKRAETISQYCKKGKPLYIESKAKVETWDDKQTGAKKSKVAFNVESFQFLGDSQRESSPTAQRPAAPKAATPSDDLPPDAEDDVPF